MAYNIVHYDETSNAIQKFSSNDLADLAEVVLEYMAAGTYTGSITIGSSNPIGVFTDTVLQGGVGSSDITVLSNTYTLSQINSTTLANETDPPKYMGLEIAEGEVVIQENSTTLENLADEILIRMVSGSSNSYYLGVSAPADGGVWSSLGTLADTIGNFTVTVNTYHLWKKISSGSSINYKRPLKLVNSELVEFTPTEIQRLVKIIEQRIISTGVGTYVLQTSIPTEGAWSAAGTVTDTRRAYTGAEFDGSSFDAVYTGINPDGTNFQGPPNYYVFYYRPSYTGSFAGLGPAYIGTRPVNFIGPGTIAYLGPGGSFGSMGTGQFPFYGPGLNYSGVFYGPPIAGYGVDTPNYFGPLSQNFSGPPAYTATYTSIAVGSTTEIITTATLWKRVG